MPAELLGQCLEVERHLLADEPRYEPVELRGVELIEQVQGHRQRHAVQRMRRFETVSELESDAIDRHAIRELRLADIGSRVAHQVFARHAQQRGIRGRGLFPPMFETGAVVYARGNQRVVESEYRFLIDQHVGPPRLVLECADFADELPVVRIERRRGLIRIGGETGAYEHLARFNRIDRPIMHAPARYQSQTI